MAETTTTSATPPHAGLPNEIVVWEILVRLPPKALLRCRAVCSTWRRATSTRNFLLVHHSRQPSLSLLSVCCIGECLDFICLDHRPGLVVDDQLQSVTRPRHLDHTPGPGLVAYFSLEACCDGLLGLSVQKARTSQFALLICNPATRQYALLPMLSDFSTLLGMYPHPSTGEYRVLMCAGLLSSYQLASGIQEGCYVLSLGSDHPPRHIGWANIVECNSASVLFRGCLHWPPMQSESQSNTIMVFDTTAESFRQMRAPALLGWTNLFEMDGMLGMSSLDDDGTIIDIWVLHDYESEVWTFKSKIELPITEIKVACERRVESWRADVVSGDGELLVLVKFSDWPLEVNMDGKLVANFGRKDVWPTPFRLKQTLVPHAFFTTLEGYTPNEFSFI